MGRAEDIKEDIKTQQDKILQTILELQANTAYGKEHDFRSISDRIKFREKVSVNTYQDLEPYINRMADDGEENVLTVDKILGFSTSSGTTGKSKRIPFVARQMKETTPAVMPLARVSHLRSPKSSLGRSLFLGYKPKVTQSKAGYDVAPISYLAAKGYKGSTGMTLTPGEVYHEVENEDAGLYCHAVFAFGEREVSEIQPILSTLGLAFWRLSEMLFTDICDDMAEGTLKRCPNLDPEIRTKLEKQLAAVPERAQEVRREFEKGNDGLQLRIWPDCKRAGMFTTGGFAAHAKLLADSYMKGVYFVDLVHNSSEALIGVNYHTDPNVHEYSFARCNVFFELIPEENIHDDSPGTVFLDEVETGKSYEVVLTTTAGLYRYRLGDVVKITGKYFSTPEYEFQYRVGQMLNVYWEKTPENLFYAALAKTAEELDVTVRDYTTCEDFVVRGGIKGLDLPDQKLYILFIEVVEQKILSGSSIEKFDDKLQDGFDIYKNLRSNGSIERMMVIQVKENSFKLVKELLIKETQNLQFKMPRVLRRVDALKVLFDNKAN